MELEAAGLRCRFGREAPNDLAIFLGMLKDAERTAGEILQVELGITSERISADARRANILDHVKARLSTQVIVASRHEIATNAGQKTIGSQATRSRLWLTTRLIRNLDDFDRL